MERLKDINWKDTRDSLDQRGFALVPSLLSADQCAAVIDMYDDNRLFRSTINMQRYRFGKGEYKYFEYTLPKLIQDLREKLYPFLVPLANEWMQRLEVEARYPAELRTFLATCHAKNQRRPTPLILRYEAGGYNTLHQDIYGEVFFPFQVVVMLTQQGKDYEGGELVFVEQLPRSQSRAEVVSASLGDAIVFTTNFRPVKGSRGYYRAKMKHGVSRVKDGLRYTIGVIFHDAG